MMLKVLAKEPKSIIVVVNYYFFGIYKNKAYPVQYLASIARDPLPTQFGDFTDEYDKGYLDKIYAMCKNHVDDCNKALLGEGLTQSEINEYMKTRYEQNLVGVNEWLNHTVYSNVKPKEGWIDDYSGLF